MKKQSNKEEFALFLVGYVCTVPVLLLLLAGFIRWATGSLYAAIAAAIVLFLIRDIVRGGRK